MTRSLQNRRVRIFRDKLPRYSCNICKNGSHADESDDGEVQPDAGSSAADAEWYAKSSPEVDLLQMPECPTPDTFEEIKDIEGRPLNLPGTPRETGVTTTTSPVIIKIGEDDCSKTVKVVEQTPERTVAEPSSAPAECNCNSEDDHLPAVPEQNSAAHSILNVITINEQHDEQVPHVPSLDVDSPETVKCWQQKTHNKTIVLTTTDHISRWKENGSQRKSKQEDVHRK